MEENKPKICGEIEREPLDVSKYIGNKVEIGEVELKEGKFGWYYLVTSKSVETQFELTATKILGLNENEDGSFGWYSGSKTDNFLKAMKVSKPEELVGKKVVVQTTESKDGTKFLTF